MLSVERPDVRSSGGMARSRHHQQYDDRDRATDHPANPCGFCDCQRQVSAHMSSIDFFVLQPSSALALDGSA